MFLKRLECYGFKSFADRTSFDFEKGVTALVGPNGCGKSNVVDAIRWVLGEQSAKSLRGSEMTDVIFNGTASRRPLGYAEVFLHFDNAGRILPVDFEEVVVGRRLYRTGESEYSINKRPCRLRDVREMFMDTGVGAGAYSIIEQGRVDALLQANAKERRALFEDAAGISKYKARKLTALRRLDRVDANLLRVADVVAEVERQLRSIQRQAAKARRYQRLDGELRTKRVALFIADWRELAARRAEVGEELARAAETAASLGAALERVESEILEAETYAVAAERECGDAERRRAGARQELVRLEGEIAAAEEMARALDAEAESAEAEAAEDRRRAEASETERATALEAAAELARRIEAADGVLAGRESALVRAREEARALAGEIEEMRTRAIDLLRRRAGLESQVARIAAEADAIRSRVERVRERLGVLASRAGEVAAESESATIRLAESEARGREVGDAVRLAREEENAAAGEIAALDERAGRLRAERERSRSRLDLLEDLEQRMEGLSVGVKGLLSRMRAGHPELAGLRGIVADLVQVDERYEVAIENALGARAQNVVAATTRDTRDAIELLKRESLGRVTFLPADRMRPTGWIRPEALLEEGVVGRAVDLVSFDEENRPVLEHLLATVLVVDSLATAIRVSRGSASAARIVTLEGELLFPGGAMTGGRYRRPMPGLIGRKGEIERLRGSLGTLEIELASLGRERVASEGGRARAREEAERLVAEYTALTAETVRLGEVRDALEREGARVAEERALAVSELEHAERDASAAAGRLEAERARCKELAVDEEGLGGEVAAREGRLAALRGEISEITTECSRLRAESARLREDHARMTESESRLATLIAERASATELHARRAADARRRAGESRVRVASLRERVDEAVRGEAELEAEARRLAGAREAVRASLEEARTKSRELRDRVRAAEREKSEIEMKRQEIALRLEALEVRAGEEAGASLAEAAAGAPEVQDLEALRAEIEDIDRKLRSLGSVNLAAIQDEEALKERRATLTTQRADLERARDKLREAIRMINRISRERFLATFEAVATEFTAMFRKLFGGGRAEVRLAEGEDVLEAGIEIVARPPGKQLRTLSLLSGGEKVLTTISLLFAVFKAKPSPFCLLDEVDAPLDEANVDRFMLVVKEFIERSQFLLITHNKRTMSLADAIYGVTMQESGVSRKIAVKIEAVEELAVA